MVFWSSTGDVAVFQTIREPDALVGSAQVWQEPEGCRFLGDATSCLATGDPPFVRLRQVDLLPAV